MQNAAVSMMMAGGRRRFSISPDFAGKSVWDLDVDGPLNIGTPGTWTITPLASFRANSKGWGAGTATHGTGNLGSVAGAYTGRMQFHYDVPYTLSVGSVGGPPAGAPGGGLGGSTGSSGYGGGGFTGIRTQAGAAKLIAGGAGGPAGGAAGVGSRGGAGGGLEGQDGLGGDGGDGGTQTTGDPWQGGAGAGAPFDSGGGGGGGGYRGGAGGGYASGGGGGSGYSDPIDVTEATLFAGAGDVPGNGADPERAGAGAIGAGGRLIIS